MNIPPLPTIYERHAEHLCARQRKALGHLKSS